MDAQNPEEVANGRTENSLLTSYNATPVLTRPQHAFYKVLCGCLSATAPFPPYAIAVAAISAVPCPLLLLQPDFPALPLPVCPLLLLPYTLL